ncbi:MAG TPA: FhaA domain-containing protein [Anaerolineaceae bacterium]
MAGRSPEQGWHLTLIDHHFLWTADAIRPADLSSKLRDIMLARDNQIEDVNFQKVVPNRFVIEVNAENYSQNFQPIEPRVTAQWRQGLLSDLEMANSRQGRREYHFAGRVSVQVRPGDGLAPNQARVFCQIERDVPGAGASALPAELFLPAGLELVPDGKTWRLHRGTVTLGRDESCDIVLDMPAVRERRLVSAQHAYLRCDERSYVLFDGSPSGRESTNGTFVNLQRVPPHGTALKDGDEILLAAVRASDPRTDTPGVAVLRFKLEAAR